MMILKYIYILLSSVYDIIILTTAILFGKTTNINQYPGKLKSLKTSWYKYRLQLICQKDTRLI